MIRYIAFFDRTAERYCSDLIPVDDSIALIYRLAKRFSFSKYCSFVKLNEISCHLIAKWDSENRKNPLQVEKVPQILFTLDKIDELYAEYARSQKIEGIQGVTVPEVQQTNYGDFVREIEAKKIKEENEKNEE